MKIFIKKIAIFLILITSIAVISEFLLRRIPNDYSYKRAYLDVQSGDVEILIFGSSHAFFGIDPSYFSDRCFNASHVSQSLDYDLEILKKYENRLGQLKTIILPISYFSLFEKLKTQNDSWRIKNYNIYYGLNSSYSLADNMEIFSSESLTNCKRIFSFYINGNSKITCSEFGWCTLYKSEESKDLNETGKVTAKRHTFEDYNNLNDNISILRSIIKLCNRHNVNVILYTPPAFKSYCSYLDNEQLNITIDISNEISNTFDNCTYINLLESNQFVEQDFYDGDHLNEIGAKKLSLLLNKFTQH